MKRVFNNDVYEPVASKAAQQKYCKNNNLPFFAPDSCSGTEYMTHPIILIWDYISVNYAMTNHIIDCPLCHKSFCD